MSLSSEVNQLKINKDNLATSVNKINTANTSDGLTALVTKADIINTKLKNLLDNGIIDTKRDTILNINAEAYNSKIDILGNTIQNSILPSNYTQLDYIQSSGTQHIDTGFKPNRNTRVDTKIDVLDGNTLFNNPFGARNDNTEQFFIGLSTGTVDKKWFLRYGSLEYISTFGVNPGLNIISFNKNVVTINSDSYTFGTQTFTSRNNLWLFACNNNGSAVNRNIICKMYYAKIWDNDVLIRSMIPAKRNSDNVLGMYDIVNDVFYTNAGTGVFTAGTVSTLPNPDYPENIQSSGDNGNITEIISNENILSVPQQSLDTRVTIKDDTIIINGKCNNATKSLGMNLTRIIKVANYSAYINPNNYTIKLGAGKYLIKVENISGSLKNINLEKISLYINPTTNLPNYPISQININSTGTFTSDSDFNFMLGLDFTASDVTEDNFDNYTIRVMLEKVPTTQTVIDNYIAHEEKDFIIPTQQPMRKISAYQDTFTYENKKWQEKHWIGKSVINLTSILTLSNGNKASPIYVTNKCSGAYGDYCSVAKSEYSYLPNTIYENPGNFVIVGESTDTLATLQTKFNEGILYYVLATPTYLDCTTEQIAVLEQMQKIQLYDGINNIYSTDAVSSYKSIKYIKNIKNIFI